MHTLRREEADLKRSANVVPAETPGALPQSRSAGELGRDVHCSNWDICRKRDNLVGASSRIYVASASTGTIVYGLVSRPPLLRGPAKLASSRRPRRRAQGQLDAEMACIRCDTRLPSRSRRTERRISPVARSPIAKRSCSKAPGHVWAGEASEYGNGTCGQHAQNSRVSALLISAR